MRPRARFALVVAASLVLALPGVGLAAAPGDSAIGHGHIAGAVAVSADFSIVARSGPAGEFAKGRLILRNVDGIPRNDGIATVECLLVDGNRAMAIGLWEGDAADWPFGPAFPHAAVYVEDNGPANGATPDRAQANAVTGGSCEQWIQFFPYLAEPLAQGNVTIHDATP